MNKLLEDSVKRGLESGRSPEELKSELVKKGFMEDEVLEIMSRVGHVEKSDDDKRNIKIFTFKEVFDRVGYGFSSTQFINILFYIIGANFFLIGVVNGLKSVLSLIFSSALQEYSKVKQVTGKLLSRAGIVFGFSFLILGMSIVSRSIPLFSISLLVGAIGVVTYGDLYDQFAAQHLRRERIGRFLSNVSHIGVIITGLSMVLSGILFDMFPMIGAQKIMLFGKSMPVFGYLLCFEITAISFILSGYVLHFVKESANNNSNTKGFLRDYLSRVKSQTGTFLRDKHLVLLLLASSVTSLVQILGNSYYGVYLYQKFEEGSFYGIFNGLFLNLAFLFLFAIVVSFMGPAFSSYLNKHVGLAPSLVFGAMLTAIMPLVCAYNPHFMPIFFANALSVIGSAILGMSQGLLVRKLLRDDQRSLYYAVLGFVAIIPFLLIIPAGAWVAQTLGLILLFKILASVMLVVATPIYFILVLLANRQRL